MKTISRWTLIAIIALTIAACGTAPKDQNNTRVNIPDTDTTAVAPGN